MQVKTIALNTFRETIRDRILYSLLVFAVLMIGLSYFLSELSVGDFERIVINFGLACVHVFGAIISIFIGITLVSKEVEKRTIYSLISKPVSRFQFLLGKFLGLSLTVFVTTLLMSVVSVLIVYLQSGNFRAELFPVAGAIYLELLLLIAASIFFSSFTTPTLSAIFSLSLFLIGHLSPQLRFFGMKAKSAFLKGAALATYYLLPNLENFNLKNVVLYGVKVDGGRVLLMFGYFALYFAILMTLSWVIFSRRDFK
ncbi:MAG: ABC transporter permease [Deltaproteobacteria bacterium]|nr:MAG: ABC transporter permease [Deltaproteobacteria bacterium]